MLVINTAFQRKNNLDDGVIAIETSTMSSLDLPYDDLTIDQLGKGKREGEGEGDEMMLEQRTMVTLPIRSPVRWIKEDEPIRLGRPRSRSWTLYDSQISLQARMNSLLRKSTRSHPRPVSLATLTPLMAGVVSAPSSSDTVMTSAGWGSASSSWAPSRWIGSFIESPPARS